MEVDSEESKMDAPVSRMTVRPSMRQSQALEQPLELDDDVDDFVNSLMGGPKKQEENVPLKYEPMMKKADVEPEPVKTDTP